MAAGACKRDEKEEPTEAKLDSLDSSIKCLVLTTKQMTSACQRSLLNPTLAVAEH
jgi:hypothetical protein